MKLAALCCTFRRPHTLGQLIESYLRQDYPRELRELIILDDALVHSDSQRMENMQRILYDAAQRHQVLLFTCHRERWPELGVAARELRSFVTSHTAPSRVSAKTALTADDF